MFSHNKAHWNTVPKPLQFTALGTDATIIVGRDRETEDREFIRAMVLSPDPIATAPELAEELGMTQQNAHKRLQALEEEGLVRSKKIGAAARAWWVTDRGRQELRSEDAGAGAEGA